MKYNELKRILSKHGCWKEKENGNHEWWYSPITNRHFPVSRHGNEEARTGTINNIKKQSGVDF